MIKIFRQKPYDICLPQTNCGRVLRSTSQALVVCLMTSLALLVTRDSSMRVLAVGLQQLMMAFSALVVLPVIVFHFFTPKHFAEGITTTGTKG